MASEETWTARQSLKITSLSTCGIQSRILAVLNTQGPLFIGWGAEWATTVICTDAVRTVNLGRPDGQLCDRIFWEFRWKSFLFKSCVRTVRHNRPDGHTSIVSNFHISFARSDHGGWTSGRLNFNTQFLYLQCARPDQGWQTSGRLKSNRQFP